ncbi:MAG: hypothetical protein A3C04_02810 [Candidatus Wildermuthbacteria bacterium RIFCSPHIGHO2_02_FULL_45_25]|uniref:Transcription regulator TrmB N-terminal domain-containing protein n=1 Tax=Candidatus Wildermuthbacteria bacterium RIFCSPHIGHO2_02_FULL_45_25 TaxID=1802450 RepID=A0A1G2R3I6_9BACT|nr:MAG: hypothetical protein A3C04_02810 [Candidatus Wildermuthbacteria bacterium RIFCSPHIGHO2_02_FULL_45_25]
MNTQIPMELRKLGLKEKEVRIYLAGLELGPNTVQNIAQKAGVTRPTCYEIIQSLEERGLFSQEQRGKKRYFAAQSPEKILHLLRIQKREIEEKEREFIRIIAALESQYAAKDHKGISIFHGEEGINLLYEKISFAASPQIFVITSQHDARHEEKRTQAYEQIKKRLGRIEAKEIVVNAKGPKRPFAYGDRSYIINSAVPFRGTLVLFEQAVFFPDEKTEGHLIESSHLISLTKSLAFLLWEYLPTF